MIVRNLYLGASPINRIYKGGVVIWDAKTLEYLYLDHIANWFIRVDEDLYGTQIGVTQLQKDDYLYITSISDANVIAHILVHLKYDETETIYVDSNQILTVVPIVLSIHESTNAIDVQVAPTKQAVAAGGKVIYRFEHCQIIVDALTTSVAGFAKYIDRTEKVAIYVAEFITSVACNAKFVVRDEDNNIYITEQVAGTDGKAQRINRREANSIYMKCFNASMVGNAKFVAREADYTFYIKELSTQQVADVIEIFFKRNLHTTVEENVAGFKASAKDASYDGDVEVLGKTTGGYLVIETVGLHQNNNAVLQADSNSFLKNLDAGNLYHDLIEKMPKIEDLNSVCCDSALCVHTFNQFEESNADLSSGIISSLSFATKYSVGTESSASMGIYFAPIKTGKNLYIRQVYNAIPNNKNLKIS